MNNSVLSLKTHDFLLINELTAMEFSITLNSKNIKLHFSSTLIDNKRIMQLIKPIYQQHLDILMCFTVNSTNDWVKVISKNKVITLAVAERQMKGRGTNGKTWKANFGDSILMSLCFQRDKDDFNISGLSLMVSISIMKVLKKFNIENLVLKWPNDILWKSKKLSGVLVEIDGDIADKHEVVIGIGINVKNSINLEIDQPTTDLLSISGRLYDRNELIAEIVNFLLDDLKVFNKYGFVRFFELWNEYDIYKDKMVNMNSDHCLYSGLNKGVDKNGNLQILIENSLKTFVNGQVSKIK